MDGGTDIEFFAPIRVGDTLTARSKIVDIYQKEGRSGPLIFVVRETTYTNQTMRSSLLKKGRLFALQARSPGSHGHTAVF